MNILIALLIGGIIGWLASLVMKTESQMGLFGNIAVGLLGSWLGFWGAAKLGIQAESTLARWCVAVAGAVVLIVILRFLGLFK
jgi:uncharacterized membrane protein YeaQ/YmgE (transglycosylase-associated protein family)